MSNDPIHQLVPRYRETGTRSMLVWYEHNEGHHVIVAKNESRVLETLRGVWHREEDAQPKEYRDIEIVMPPQDLCEAYAKHQAGLEFDSFTYWVHGMADHYYRLHKELPPYYKACPGYKSKDRHVHDDEYHFECANCDGMRRKLVGVTLEQLFERNKQLHRDDKQGWRTRVIPFTGKACEPDKELYVAVLNGGHHSPGVVIKKVEKTANIDVFTSPVLFFFHGSICSIPTSIADAHKEHRKNLHLEGSRAERARKNQARKIDEERANLLLKVLGV